MRSTSCKFLTCWLRECSRINRGRVGRRLLWGGVAVDEGRRSLGQRCLLSQESRWRACLGDGGCPNFELRSKFTRSATSADRASLKTRHRRVFLTLRALSGSNPPPSASTWQQGAFSSNYSIVGNSMKKENGGERGIRTPGALITLNGFQDRRIKPLCHLSVRLNDSIELGGYRRRVHNGTAT